MYIFILRFYYFLFLSIFLSFNFLSFKAEEITNNSKFPDYIFGPGDKLKINVYKMKDFDAETKIQPDGTINLPRIGKIRVADLTLNEIEQKLLINYIRRNLQEYIILDLVKRLI